MVLQARDFSDVVPVRVVVTPQNGVPQIIDAEIDMSEANPASIELSIDIPENMPTNVSAFTRDSG